MKAEVAAPFVSFQMDMWSSKNSKESYACMMASVVRADRTTKDFSLIQLCLEFGCFPFVLHTAKNISIWIKRALQTWGLRVEDCVAATPDGASSMVKACVLADVPVSVCDAHNLQRCVLYSTGHAGGGVGENPDCRDHIAEQRALVSVFNHSTKNQKLLQAAQGPDAQLVPKQDSPTRWDGTWSMIKTNNLLQFAFAEVGSDAEVASTADTEPRVDVTAFGFSDDEEDAAPRTVDSKTFRLPDAEDWRANRQLEATLLVRTLISWCMLSCVLS